MENKKEFKTMIGKTVKDCNVDNATTIIEFVDGSKITFRYESYDVVVAFENKPTGITIII